MPPSYDQALAAGLPIAAGIIEGACRHLIGDRLDITRASCGLQDAETILTPNEPHPAQMHAHCRVCAEACRRCERACRELLDAMN